MAQGSGIEWTESTWNPVTGCAKISPGCKHCYAERMAERLQAMGQANYANGFALTLQPQMLERPLTWKTPQTIFVNSMSDLFHDDVPLAFIRRVFDVMARAHWHRFQVLTKRAERLQAIGHALDWPANVWMGVQRRERSLPAPGRPTPCRAGADAVPLAGTAAWSDPRPESVRHRLGDRRRGVRSRRTPDEPCVGHRSPRPVCSRERAVLFQAVGGTEQEGHREGARGSRVGRDAAGRVCPASSVTALPAG